MVITQTPCNSTREFPSCTYITYFCNLFRSGVLVCTDVMARGIDIPNIHFVLQYDPPSQARWALYYYLFQGVLCIYHYCWMYMRLFIWVAFILLQPFDELFVCTYPFTYWLYHIRIYIFIALRLFKLFSLFLRHAF